MKKIMRFALSSAATALIFLGYTSANADITLSFKGPMTENFCANLANTNWTGSGRVDGVLVKCSYNGRGTVTGSAPNYRLQIHADRTDGTLCPGSVDATLNATCSDNNITLSNNNVNLKGSFNGENQMNASGSVGFSGITAPLSVHGQRAG